MALTINKLFDEQFYLETNPEVAGAVANNIISDGFFHFIRFGQFEGRDPSGIFNTNFFSLKNRKPGVCFEKKSLRPI